MRAILLFTFLIGLLGQDQIRDARPFAERTEADIAITQRSTVVESAVRNEAEPPFDIAAEEEPALEVKEDSFSLNDVNGLTLYDSKQDVEEKLGNPNSIEQDEYLKDAVTYHYNDISIYFYQDYIQSIDFSKSVKELNIDGVIVKANAAALKAALGEPDYVAEDGIVFQREECLLKVFIDSESGDLEWISYYHISSV